MGTRHGTNRLSQHCPAADDRVSVLARTIAPTPVFAHLLRLTDDRGVYEHASFTTPRRDHGYRADDVARALVVVLREPVRTRVLDEAVLTYLCFLEGAVTADGSVRSRRSASGDWSAELSTGDSWGLTVHALGFAARAASTRALRHRSTRVFLRVCRARTVDARAAAFAAIGAAEFLRGRADLPGPARDLLTDCLERIPRGSAPGWAWPEPRLRHANAALCDALVYGGGVLRRVDDVREGLRMLTELLRIETGEREFLSVTGAHGRGPGEAGPLWDQQPIEPAAIADACAHAAEVSGDASWHRKVQLAWAWFMGANDSRVVIYDSATGAGHDGLHPQGRSQDCGAESTLAALGTLQQVRALPASRW